MPKKREESWRHGVSNWAESDLPTGTKIRKVFQNNLKKALTLKPCCGHHGDPGC